MKRIAKPMYNEHALYYEAFINAVDQKISVLDQLKAQAKEIEKLLLSLTEKQLTTPYETGKWTIKEILQHLIDMDCVLLYRALCFGRNDKEPKYFFDEKKFIENSIANSLSLKKLLKLYKLQRAAALAFFQNQNATTLKRKGMASNTMMSVRACAWVLCGHEIHHINIIKQKYL